METVQSHTQDIVPVETKTNLTTEQEELLWWEHYEIISLTNYLINQK
jgi:hypothetical protein